MFICFGSLPVTFVVGSVAAKGVVDATVTPLVLSDTALEAVPPSVARLPALVLPPLAGKPVLEVLPPDGIDGTILGEVREDLIGGVGWGFAVFDPSLPGLVVLYLEEASE